MRPTETPTAGDLKPADSRFVCGAEYDANGVDLSLLRARLRLAPVDRLRRMEQHAAEAQALNEYGRRHREAEAASNR